MGESLQRIVDPVMRAFLSTLAVAALVTAAAARAQTPVHTEVVTPYSASPAFNRSNNSNHSDVVVTGTIPPPTPPPEVISDLARLPPAVARMRERILAAARTGRLDAVVAVMASNGTMPIFSLNGDKDPVVYWRQNYPDSAGVEILAILTEILETGFVHVDKGTPEEMYVWPYFSRAPLEALSPEQKVELFKIVTGGDYKDMLGAGTYNFFRLGIGQDGAWRFFVTGD
jgi:hypothetical protein